MHVCFVHRSAVIAALSLFKSVFSNTTDKTEMLSLTNYKKLKIKMCIDKIPVFYNVQFKYDC